MRNQAQSGMSARRIYMVLSPRALPYARLALRTLLANCDEPLDLHLITDSEGDKRSLETAVSLLNNESQHRVSVVAEEELADRESERFTHFPNLRVFRHGHPCWRKITDPLLLAHPGEEMVLLDPDLYFPNRFRFEATPAKGLLLMWQRPNCLLPSSVVHTAMDAGIPLARHVDIGVAHWRLSADWNELSWIDWLLAQLGGASLPHVMHVEAIVWSAIAMRFGGGYLNPQRWVCWHRTQPKRIARRLGVSGPRILAGEHWPEMKCFHAGGEAKWWLADAESSRIIRTGATQLAPSRVRPFVELTPQRYEREQSAKSILAGIGYYRLFNAGRP